MLEEGIGAPGTESLRHHRLLNVHHFASVDRLPSTLMGRAEGDSLPTQPITQTNTIAGLENLSVTDDDDSLPTGSSGVRVGRRAGCRLGGSRLFSALPPRGMNPQAKRQKAFARRLDPCEPLLAVLELRSSAAMVRSSPANHRRARPKHLAVDRSEPATRSPAPGPSSLAPAPASIQYCAASDDGMSCAASAGWQQRAAEMRRSAGLYGRHRLEAGHDHVEHAIPRALLRRRRFDLADTSASTSPGRR
jgi:hypothetical protein